VAEELIYAPVRTGRNLPDQIARQILDLVSSRQLRVGSRLPPLDELGELLGVSRTALREALKLLEAWGIIVVKPGIGTFIAEVAADVLAVPLKISAERSDQSIRHLHQLREAVEPPIAALAALHARPEHIAKLEEAVARMDAALNDPTAYIQADLDFHSTLADATGNNLFLLVIYPVIDLLQEARLRFVQNPGAGERAQTFHRLLLEQIKAGNAAGARAAMQAHLDQAWGELPHESDALPRAG